MNVAGPATKTTKKLKEEGKNLSSTRGSLIRSRLLASPVISVKPLALLYRPPRSWLVNRAGGRAKFPEAWNYQPVCSVSRGSSLVCSHSLKLSFVVLVVVLYRGYLYFHEKRNLYGGVKDYTLPGPGTPACARRKFRKSPLPSLSRSA
jgi:hypothetical protein